MYSSKHESLAKNTDNDFMVVDLGHYTVLASNVSIYECLHTQSSQRVGNLLESR